VVCNICIKVDFTFGLIAVQGHPRSIILVPIEIAYATSYQFLIVTLFLSCTVSEIRPLIRWKLRIFPTSQSFGAPAPYVPFGILRWS